jgi:hypothetical protein
MVDPPFWSHQADKLAVCGIFSAGLRLMNFSRPDQASAAAAATD